MPQDEAEISPHPAPQPVGSQRRLFARARWPAKALPARFSLEEALRRSGGGLPAISVANLLAPLAQIVDAAEPAGLDLTPGGVWIVAETPAPGAVPFTDALLTEGLLRWLEVHPTDAARPQNAANHSFAVPVAALTYELLGGAASGYQVLPECDEEANALLRRALEGGGSEFADAVTFATALDLPLRRPPPESSHVPSPPVPAKMRRKKRRRAPKAAEKRGPSVKPAVVALAALALIAALGWWARAPKTTPKTTPRATPKITLRRNEDYETGLNLWNGMGRTLIDQPQAVSRFQAAAATGYAPAEAFLAVICRDGFGGSPRDAVHAEKWAKASLQAGLRQETQEGDAEAQLRLGLLYDEGIGVTKDRRKAVELYQKAADQGNASGEYSLGVCYFNGSGVKRDLAKATDLYQKAAAQGNAFAQNNLAFCYQIGGGVAQDMNKAIELYQKAAAQGNAIAQKNLGVLYFNGIGVAKDLAKAIEFYQKSAERGNALAEFNLGVCYENGAGVQKDLSKAIEFYRKAAAQGDDSAQNALGSCYENGIGVERDRDKAIAFYIKAADQGNGIAQGRLRNLLYETRK